MCERTLRQNWIEGVRADRTPFAYTRPSPGHYPWQWRIAVGDPAEVAGIVRQHEWLEANRDLDGDGLIWIVQPDESGLDDSTQFDPIWRKRDHGLPGFVLLVRRNRRLGYDLRRIA